MKTSKQDIKGKEDLAGVKPYNKSKNTLQGLCKEPQDSRLRKLYRAGYFLPPESSPALARTMVSPGENTWGYLLEALPAQGLEELTTLVAQGWHFISPEEEARLLPAKPLGKVLGLNAQGRKALLTWPLTAFLPLLFATVGLQTVITVMGLFITHGHLFAHKFYGIELFGNFFLFLTFLLPWPVLAKVYKEHSLPLTPEVPIESSAPIHAASWRALQERLFALREAFKKQAKASEEAGASAFTSLVEAYADEVTVLLAQVQETITKGNSLGAPLEEALATFETLASSHEDLLEALERRREQEQYNLLALEEEQAYLREEEAAREVLAYEEGLVKSLGASSLQERLEVEARVHEQVALALEEELALRLEKPLAKGPRRKRVPYGTSGESS